VEGIIVEACASICLKTSKQSNIYHGHGGQNSNIEKDARYSEFDNSAAGFMAKKTATPPMNSCKHIPSTGKGSTYDIFFQGRSYMG
jgi:hypothetical protein